MRRWQFLVAGSVVVVAAAVWLWAPNRTGDRTSAVVIGAISPFTGDGAVYGRAARTGIDLALDEINGQGGIHGRQLRVRYEDDRGNPKDALSAFEKLVSVDKVQAVLGPFYSSNVLAVAPRAESARVVLITGSGTSDNISHAGEFTFRTCPRNVEQARIVAAFARGTLSLQRAFIIYRNVDYGVTLRDAFIAAFGKLGGNVVGQEAVPPEATDVRAQLASAKASSADMIFAAVHYPEGAALLRQAKELAVSCTILGTDGGFDPALLKIAGDSAEGSYWATIGWASGSTAPQVDAFRKKYAAKFGNEPGVYSGLYYDATLVLAQAMRSAVSLDGPAIQTALKHVKLEGVTGMNSFDALGDVSKPFAVYEIRGGAFRRVDTLLPAG